MSGMLKNSDALKLVLPWLVSEKAKYTTGAMERSGVCIWQQARVNPVLLSSSMHIVHAF